MSSCPSSAPTATAEQIETHTGRPSPEWIAQAQAATDRKLAPQKRGPKSKADARDAIQYSTAGIPERGRITALRVRPYLIRLHIGWPTQAPSGGNIDRISNREFPSSTQIPSE
jgi:hypothetical protein